MSIYEADTTAGQWRRHLDKIGDPGACPAVGQTVIPDYQRSLFLGLKSDTGGICNTHGTGYRNIAINAAASLHGSVIYI